MKKNEKILRNIKKEKLWNLKKERHILLKKCVKHLSSVMLVNFLTQEFRYKAIWSSWVCLLKHSLSSGSCLQVQYKIGRRTTLRLNPAQSLYNFKVSMGCRMKLGNEIDNGRVVIKKGTKRRKESEQERKYRLAPASEYLQVILKSECLQRP